MADNTGSAFPGLPQIMDKQFWSRPEGYFAMFVLAGLALATGVGVIAYLPAVMAYIAGITASVFSTVAHGVGAFALIYVTFIDDGLRKALGLGWRSLMRGLAGIIINISPISVVRDYIDLLRKRMVKMEGAIRNLKTQVTSLQQLIAKQQEEINESMKRMSAGKKLGGASVLKGKQEGQIAGMLEKSNVNLKRLLTKMELVYRVLLKMHEAAQFSISVTEQKVDITIREATALKAGAEAAKEAMAIINGDPTRKAHFDQAMGRLAWETASAVAEIDNFMEMSQSFFNTVDLEKAVADEDAMKMLEQWEANLEGGVLLGGGAKASIVNDANNPNVMLDLNQGPAPRNLTSGPSDVKSYFDN